MDPDYNLGTAVKEAFHDLDMGDNYLFLVKLHKFEDQLPEGIRQQYQKVLRKEEPYIKQYIASCERKLSILDEEKAKILMTECEELKQLYR
ncbi:MAG: hypothetical protein R6V53_05160 [Candidatus Woesearchaeota archaeon]